MIFETFIPNFGLKLRGLRFLYQNIQSFFANADPDNLRFHIIQEI